MDVTEPLQPTLEFSLPRESSPIEKALLLVRAFPAQDHVAMGKTTEAGNDVPMLHGIGHIRLADLLHPAYTFLLIGEILGMHVRHGEELVQVVADMIVIASRQGTLGDAQSFPVGRKCARRSTKHVARKLVEDEDESQSSIGLLGPSVEFTRRSPHINITEALRDHRIEVIVPLEPTIGTQIAPEIDDGLGIDRIFAHEDRLESRNKVDNGPSHRTSIDANKDPSPKDDALPVLDLLGLKCPLPVLRTRKALAMGTPGTSMVVLTDDALAPLDLEHLCRTEGHEIEGRSREPGGGWRFVVRRGASQD